MSTSFASTAAKDKAEEGFKEAVSIPITKETKVFMKPYVLAVKLQDASFKCRYCPYLSNHL